MSPGDRKSLAWNVGAFVGNIWRAVRSDSPDPDSAERHEVERTVEEREEEDGVVLRRTTIDEVEFRRKDDKP